MSDVKITKNQLTQLFLRLVKCGYKLGVDEYRAGLQAWEQGYGVDEPTFLAMVEILWGHSRSRQDQLRLIWKQLQAEQPKTTKENDRSTEPVTQEESQQQSAPGQSADTWSGVAQPREERLPTKNVTTVMVRAPSFNPVERDDILSFKNYFPLSQRQMIYGWRFLRRMVADGCQDILDVAATIKAVSDRGYYLAPVYQRRQRNAAKLLLIIDQNGSMMPFHRFTRDLVETVRAGSSLAVENILVFYFSNVPGAYLYSDVYLTKPVETNKILEQCDRETSVLIVSDAGAARGYRRQERIQGTTRFLLRLRQHTNLVAWLNPFSQKRWTGSSAAILAYLVPMFQMDQQGFNRAIDVVRGLVVGGEQ